MLNTVSWQQYFVAAVSLTLIYYSYVLLGYFRPEISRLFKTLIKSANIAKYYRRMITAVKKHTRRVNLSYLGARPAIFPRQLRKLYNDVNLSREKKILS